MNSKTVLQKLITLLSSNEVKLTYAKLADGTIVESPTFDVGEPLEVVSEDGTKSPAPDGEHQLSLRDEEGNETLLKVFTEGGVITERENVELEEETIEVEPLPQTTDEPEANKVEEMAEEELPMEEAPESEEEKEITINLEDVAKKMEEMQYRISELEKVLKAQEEDVKEEDIKEEMEEEEDLPKLDGAPVEAGKVSKFSKQSNNKVPSYQSAFLNKLYK